MKLALSPADRLGLAILLAVIALGGAWFTEIALGYVPCKLCLWQRWPYYLGLPLGVAALILRAKHPQIARILILTFTMLFIISAILGIYHSGVEWKWWLGPSECGGKLARIPASVEDFRRTLAAAKVIRCDDAALRILGLSFAGWNVLVSIAIAALAKLSLRNKSEA